ncbi:MAG TPA: hypothetical protein VJT73_09165 [Polyangiaceae bacterium]|nr:hypothetical protein [Polyangiaceae bacterium]
MRDDHWEFWRSVITETAAQVLSHYGMELCNPADWTPILGDGDHVVGSVYFGGSQVRGGLTLCAPRELLDTANPTNIPVPLADFAREIANQILGGVKARIASYEIEFSYQFSDPASRNPGLPVTETRTLVLRSKTGEIALMFAVASDLELELANYQPSRDLPSLGKVILF